MVSSDVEVKKKIKSVDEFRVQKDVKNVLVVQIGLSIIDQSDLSVKYKIQDKRVKLSQELCSKNCPKNCPKNYPKNCPKNCLKNRSKQIPKDRSKPSPKSQYSYLYIYTERGFIDFIVVHTEI